MGGMLGGVAAAVGDVARWEVGQVLVVMLAVAAVVVAIIVRYSAPPGGPAPGGADADDDGHPTDVGPRLRVPVVGYGVDRDQHDQRDKTRHPE